MATLKRRLHRNNGSGYDTVHFETEAKLVLMSNGTTAEDAINTKAAANHTHNDKLNVSGGKVGRLYCTIDDGIYVRSIEGATEAENGTGNGDLYLNHDRPNKTVYMGGNGYSRNVAIHSGNIESYAAAKNHNHSAANITSGVLPVTRGGTGQTSIDGLKTALGIGGSTQGMSYYLKSLTVGKLVWFNYDRWRVVHIANGLYYLIIDEITQTTQFNNNGEYKGSTIAAKCATYQNDMAADSLALCQNVTVNGVTAKVFIPSFEQMNKNYSDSFSYFATKANRICKDSGGIAQIYWTSSPSDGGSVWYVGTDGSLSNRGDVNTPTRTYGFRPCVALKL